jgi:hypothetical protein
MVMFLILAAILVGILLKDSARQEKFLWSFMFVLTLVFVSLGADSTVQNHSQSQSYVEKIIARIGGGSDERNAKPGFLPGRTGQKKAPTGPKNAPINQKTTDTGSIPGNDKGWPGANFPWGADPKYNRRDSYGAFNPHRLSAKKNWITDDSAWEDDESSNPLNVIVDFPYRLNDRNEPTLLVPNLGKPTFKGKYIRVEFQQTASHIHHAPEFQINLPDKFDMAYYRSLKRSDKIAYATRNLPRDTIVSYQNEIAKRLVPTFNPNTYSRKGVAGQKKVPTQIIIETPHDLYQLPGQQIQTPVSREEKNIMLGIITRNDLHISSYLINQNQLDKLEVENYWVLKGRNIR